MVIIANNNHFLWWKDEIITVYQTLGVEVKRPSWGLWTCQISTLLETPEVFWASKTTMFVFLGMCATSRIWWWGVCGWSTTGSWKSKEINTRKYVRNTPFQFIRRGARLHSLWPVMLLKCCGGVDFIQKHQLIGSLLRCPLAPSSLIHQCHISGSYIQHI